MASRRGDSRGDLGLHVLGFGLLFLTASGDFALGSGATFGVALGITAYTLGMRHAFDADHIAAIDNTTRKLINEDQRPLSVGFFFPLGHSTIVFVLALLLAVGIRGLSGAVESDSSTLKDVTSVIGPTVAARHVSTTRAGAARSRRRPTGCRSTSAPANAQPEGRDCGRARARRARR